MKFVLQLHIDGVDFENAEARAKIWLKEELFNATQKKQLAAVCQNMKHDVTLQPIFRARFDFYHESMNGMAEVPIEVYGLALLRRWSVCF